MSIRDALTVQIEQCDSMLKKVPKFSSKFLFLIIMIVILAVRIDSERTRVRGRKVLDMVRIEAIQQQ